MSICVHDIQYVLGKLNGKRILNVTKNERFIRAFWNIQQVKHLSLLKTDNAYCMYVYCMLTVHNTANTVRSTEGEKLLFNLNQITQ